MSEQPFEDVFRMRFISVGPRILDQWSTVDPVELAATKGELVGVVDLVVRATDRSPSEIEAKLRALSSTSEAAPQADEDTSLRRRLGLASKQMDEVVHAVKRFEAFASDEARKMKSSLAPIAEKKIRANLWTSLFLALGFGFMIGLWMRGGRKS